MPLLTLEHIRRIFKEDSQEVIALKDISLTVKQGDYVAIMGESGAGKTTLLNIIATLDKASSGIIKLDDQDLNELTEQKAAKFRREQLGFVFQNFNLLNTFNNQDNIFLPLVLARKTPQEMKQRLMPLAKQLEITNILARYPYEISGGQRQRIAAARALITQPRLLLADEPTGALDSHNAASLLRLFDQVNEQGQTILMVTHSAVSASYSKRTLFIKDGVIYHELIRGDQSKRDYLTKITETLTALASEEVQ
ncbi:ABC transporter ATP-binding protein [Lentilactobacillus fungorum]|jgi:putative ABC transport system ATP-binding protein|uniref:ABC transporter ATP-binding protein n=1 Tax=Lentilactobacillus fungorum TaxID=2201250 RepID=A0ABQ3VZZ5_9LACO|nr:ABC transporter ATP-binding protein [Lentilactobacillus fungorum]GHP13988.1 ABC transporter ATP-binding protein [Lentilactobacillus fungorum]